MAPGPDEVHEHHHVAPALVGEEVEAGVAVQRQHRQGRGQDREGRHDQQVGGERGPAEHRHAQIAHAGRAHLQYGGDQIDAGDQRPYPRKLDGPKVVVHAHSRRVAQLRERRVRQPPGAGELADHQRQVDQQRAGGRQPEADRVEGRERHVAHAELQRHDEVHQPDDKWHGPEEDHHRAVGGEDLVIVLRRQEAPRMEAQRLLRANHDRVDEAADQHQQAEKAVHDADPLVVDAGDPLPPQVGDPALDGHPADQAAEHRHHAEARSQRDGLVPGNRVPGELAEQVHPPPLGETSVAWPAEPGPGPGPAGNFCMTISEKSCGETAR